MSETLELKNSNDKNIQINCVRDFTFTKNEDAAEVKKLYKIIAGEDGSIKVNDKHLPYATDRNGWLIQIDDVYLIDKNLIIIVSPDGIIAIYTRQSEASMLAENNNWQYAILREDSECYYEIKEATCIDSFLSLHIKTEFSGVLQLSFDLSI